MTTKGTAKAITNLKPLDGGAAIAQLPIGGWVYGDKGTTDLTGFTHYYLANGTRKELIKNGLPCPCKATLSNLTLVFDVVEPGIEPPPPTTDETQMLLNEHLEHIHQIKHADGTIEITEKWVGDSSTFLTKVI